MAVVLTLVVVLRLEVVPVDVEVVDVVLVVVNPSGRVVVDVFVVSCTIT